jgi:ElaB/YqjD/DUF883 family membrane-anchored ribosome-binding protein
MALYADRPRSPSPQFAVIYRPELLSVLGVSEMLGFLSFRSETMFARRGVNGSMDKVWRDLKVLQSDVAKLTQEIPSMLNDAGDVSLRAARERVDRMKRHIEDSLSQLSERGRDAVQSVNEVTHNVEETLHAHPIMIIAAAVVVGYVLGASSQGRYRQ